VALFRILLVVFTVGLASSQGTPEPKAPGEPPSSGWRRFDEPPASPPSAQEAPVQAASRVPPPEFVAPSGTWITIRVNELLSSDQNRPDDHFTGTLVQPVVVDGFVVARRGQTVGGRVTEAQKAGRVRGTSRLGIELVEIGLVDGRQIPVRTEFHQYSGGTSVGGDAAVIGTSAGFGAAVGAAADGGFGAGMGAISGAGASMIGVLLTRGRATVVEPEAVLTFRTVAPLRISTDRAQHAFQAVRQEDYEPRQLAQRTLSRRDRRPPSVLFYDYYWPYPYYWGSPFFYYRPAFFHSTHSYSHGHHRRR
jgi:hypothetical protein